LVSGPAIIRDENAAILVGGEDDRNVILLVLRLRAFRERILSIVLRRRVSSDVVMAGSQSKTNRSSSSHDAHEA
jgi:hypothetical protein